MPAFNRKTFLPSFKADTKPARFNIPVSQKSRQLLIAAKSAIENADLSLALETDGATWRFRHRILQEQYCAFAQ